MFSPSDLFVASVSHFQPFSNTVCNCYHSTLVLTRFLFPADRVLLSVHHPPFSLKYLSLVSSCSQDGPKEPSVWTLPQSCSNWNMLRQLYRQSLPFTPWTFSSRYLAIFLFFKSPTYTHSASFITPRPYRKTNYSHAVFNIHTPQKDILSRNFYMQVGSYINTGEEVRFWQMFVLTLKNVFWSVMDRTRWHFPKTKVSLGFKRSATCTVYTKSWSFSILVNLLKERCLHDSLSMFHLCASIETCRSKNDLHVIRVFR